MLKLTLGASHVYRAASAPRLGVVPRIQAEQEEILLYGAARKLLEASDGLAGAMSRLRGKHYSRARRIFFDVESLRTQVEKEAERKKP